MAIDPKTGKPVADLVTPLPDVYGMADYLADVGTVLGADVETFLNEAIRAATSDRAAPPPDVQPRGESLLRGACASWLGAQGARRRAGRGND